MKAFYTLQTSTCIAIDNSIKTQVSFIFEPEISYQTISQIIISIRRKQIGYYSNLPSSIIPTRGSLSSTAVTHFVEGTINAYNTYLNQSSSSLLEESYFYMKGAVFNAMFTHDKDGV